MNKILGITLLGFLILSCNKTDETLVGTYQLIEVLADPGDGSGKFEAVNSSKKITFKSDQSFSCEGEICGLNISSENQTNGTFDEETKTLESETCTLHYEMHGDELTLQYPCIEPCYHKYKKE